MNDCSLSLRFGSMHDNVSNLHITHFYLIRMNPSDPCNQRAKVIHQLY